MAFYPNRKSNNLASSISVLAITIGLVAGQSATQKSLAQYSTSPAPFGVLSINGAGSSAVNTLFVGSGETNPYPFGSKGSWFNVFGIGNSSSSVNLNADVPYAYLNYPSGTYGPVTTLSTFNLTILRPVSFGATEVPLAGTQVEQVVSGSPDSGKAIQVPVVGVGIALAFNRTGLNVPTSGLRLSRPTYCAIFNGTLTNWNDPRIRADNGGAIISSNRPLRFVRRSDSSGTTFALSRHLNTVCKTTATPGLPAASVWNRGTGKNPSIALYSIPSYTPACTLPAPADTVCWPSTFIGASGDEGVANVIVNTPGAIGYADSATRLARNLPAALLRNRSGAYVSPTTVGIQHALSGGTIVKYGTRNRLIRIDGLTDPTPATAYPISTASYLLFYDVYGASQTNRVARIRQFINWALADATGTLARQPIPPAANSSNPTPDEIARVRGYAPLPNSIKGVSRTVVNTCVDTVVNPSPCIP